MLRENLHLIVGGIGLLIFIGVVLASGFVRYIPNTKVGIVEKLVSGKGSVKGGFIALGGEAGFQPHVLRGGWHIFTPFQYRIRKVPLVTIPQGHLGYVFARDGAPLSQGQTLGRVVECDDFQDLEAFLKNGGQRGPQRRILREGTYAINLAQFVVLTGEGRFSTPLDKDEEGMFSRMEQDINERGGFEPVIIQGTGDYIGIVTVHDGPALPQGEIIARTVGDDPTFPETFHNGFQNPEAFLAAGGRRGRQLQVLVEGTYFINRLFATVELIEKTVIEVGYVGVVVSYTGAAGTDISGEKYRHGEMVEQGHRGVWSTALLPGKYAFNTYAGKVVAVPTTNFILKWIEAEAGSHGYDTNLAEVGLITKDAFEPRLPLSVVVHIDYKMAPLVIQRFGDIQKLVEQTLDPMVAAYFKNIGQTKTLIELLQGRSEIQLAASADMREKFERYNLTLEEVLIGTPRSSTGDQGIEQILKQLRDRQVAEEKVETYARQEKAATKERELREAEAKAKAQTALTESAVKIEIDTNQGKADLQRALQKAQEIRALAEAEADKTARIGIASAIATEEQVRAYGGPQFQVTQMVMERFAKAIETAGVDVVPKIVISNGGDDNQNGQGIMQALLGMLLDDKLAAKLDTGLRAASPEVEEMKGKIKASIGKNGASAPTPPAPKATA